MKNALESPEVLDNTFNTFSHNTALSVTKDNKGVKVKIEVKFKSGDQKETFKKSLEGDSVSGAYDQIMDAINDELERIENER